MSILGTTRTREGSAILWELCNANLQYHAGDMRAYSGQSVINDTEPMITIHNASRFFQEIYDHIRECEYFNGLIMASDNRSLQRGGRDDFMILRCSCGFELFLPISILKFQYRGRDFEDIIMNINDEYVQSTRGGIEEKILRRDAIKKSVQKIEMKDKLETVRKKTKSPLYGMEV